MYKPTRTTHPILKIANASLIDLPAPVNISIWWNYGSLLGLCLCIQIITGLFLSMHYASNIDLAFSSVIHITRDVNYGWLMRAAHTNGASMFFLFLYIHMGRGIYYNSFHMHMTWNTGVLMFIITMATAFMGYVLPWGQMSFWGATVITSIFSAIPYLGDTLVQWIWGGFAVSNPTLNRFFALHFLLPFLLMAMTAIHILFLHQTGSNNPLGINSDSDRIPFHTYYSIKDLLGYTIACLLFFSLLMYAPNILGDPENFMQANPLVTPIHIQPEWYFLWLYAILRSVPNKLGGVIALALALIMPLTLPFTHINQTQSTSFYPLDQTLFWSMVSIWLILTWLGSQPVEEPFFSVGLYTTIAFFIYFMVKPLCNMMWEFLLNK